MTQTTLSQFIHRAAGSNTTYYGAQIGLFFESMDDLIDALHKAGHKTQQNDGNRVLVDHKAWVSRHCVAWPLHFCTS